MLTIFDMLLILSCKPSPTVEKSLVKLVSPLMKPNNADTPPKAINGMKNMAIAKTDVKARLFHLFLRISKIAKTAGYSFMAVAKA